MRQIRVSKYLYLSYILDDNTPTYGNRNRFVCEKKSSIEKDDVANDSSIHTTVHMGTHIDMPYHFYDNGQTIEDFEIDYFRFDHVLFVDLTPSDIIIKDDLIKQLDQIDHKETFDILIIKTGICYQRDQDMFWQENYGFSPKIAKYLREKFPNIRALGFDSISVSSFAYRMVGREAHKAFLHPEHPILLIEDMDLTAIDISNRIKCLTVAPLRIAQCDGLPCTIVAEIA